MAAFFVHTLIFVGAGHARDCEFGGIVIAGMARSYRHCLARLTGCV